MTNEDAIKWLENLKNDIGNPHYECLLHYAQAIDEICAMLEEQEAKTQGADSGMCEICSFYERAMPVKPVLDEQTGRIWLCGNCGSYVGFEDNDPHDPNEFDKYCRECGKPVLWEGR